MKYDEYIHVNLAEILRVELVQLALLDNPMAIEQIAFGGGTEPVMLLNVEHKPQPGRDGEPVHLAVPARIAALLVGQIDALVQVVFNDAERDLFNETRERTREMCVTEKENAPGWGVDTQAPDA